MAERLLVSESYSGKSWLIAEAPDDQVRAAAQRHGLPDVVAKAILTRGIGLDEVERFLDPRIKTWLPDPNILIDMGPAVDRVMTALESGERIAVFADYDVDGATSAALLIRYLRALDVEAALHVPDRVEEGYGPNVEAYERLADEGVSLVVCVDSGTTAFSVFSSLRDSRPGLDVVVLDHHAAENRRPDVVALVNPNRRDQEPGLGHLAACGVTFLFLVGLNRALREAGAFDGPAPTDLMRLTQLVALGTVCDVVPLQGVNRALVATGLSYLRKSPFPGISALTEAAGRQQPIQPFDLGFVLGPRINAGGRIGNAVLGAELLATESESEAVRIARQLDETNAARKEMEATTVESALESVAAASTLDPVLVVAGEGWHPGVIGLVAARLKERFGRPACAVALSPDGVGKASGRSLPGFDLGEAIIEARLQGLLLSGGGHPMAAGFSIEAGKLETLRRFLADKVRALPGGPPKSQITLDGFLSVNGVSVALTEALALLEPFGSGNREPRFVVPRARVSHARIVGRDHVSAFLTDAGGGRLKAIAWRAAETKLGEALLSATGTPLALAGRVQLDHWQGETRPQFVVEDASIALNPS